MKEYFISFATLILYILLIVGVCSPLSGQPEPAGAYTSIDLIEYPDRLKEFKRVNMAMRYHGIGVARYDGEWTFMRDGQRCKLFTKGCVEWLRKGLR